MAFTVHNLWFNTAWGFEYSETSMCCLSPLWALNEGGLEALAPYDRYGPQRCVYETVGNSLARWRVCFGNAVFLSRVVDGIRRYSRVLPSVTPDVRRCARRWGACVWSQW